MSEWTKEVHQATCRMVDKGYSFNSTQVAVMLNEIERLQALVGAGPEAGAEAEQPGQAPHLTWQQFVDVTDESLLSPSEYRARMAKQDRPSREEMEYQLARDFARSGAYNGNIQCPGRECAIQAEDTVSELLSLAALRRDEEPAS